MRQAPTTGLADIMLVFFPKFVRTQPQNETEMNDMRLNETPYQQAVSSSSFTEATATVFANFLCFFLHVKLSI